MTLHGLICQTCSNHKVDSEHEKIHDMSEGEVLIWTEHSDNPAAKIDKVKSKSYMATVIANDKKIEIPEDNLNEFRLPHEEEEHDRPNLEGY